MCCGSLSHLSIIKQDVRLKSLSSLHLVGYISFVQSLDASQLIYRTSFPLHKVVTNWDRFIANLREFVAIKVLLGIWWALLLILNLIASLMLDELWWQCRE